MPQVAMLAIMAGAATYSASQSNSAGKSAKSQSDTQMRMAQASQDTLVAKEVAAKNELAASQATASAQASTTASNKKRAVARSNTIYTSPLGIGGTADVARKVLLGA